MLIKSIVAQIVLYLLVSFVAWDITWIAGVGDWMVGERYLFLFAFIVFNMLTYLILETE